MEAITQSQLLEKLNGIKGATFATFVTQTDARLKKTGNTLGPVFKVSRVNVTLGFQYENAVNRQRDREGAESDFEAAPRQWGQKISPMLVEHKGKLYVETKVERAISTEYIDAQGETLDYETVKPFLPARRPASRQDVEREVIVRDYALDSLLTVTLKGETLIVLHAPAKVMPKNLPIG